ncbi:MAG TPA: exonuclease domain-containing protein [Ktedonobacterales bacterium]
MQNDGGGPAQGQLLRRAYSWLAECGAAQTSGALVQHLFGASAGGPTGKIWLGLLEQALRGSPLFAQSADGLWRLRAWVAEQTRLADLEYVVVDVETTGLVAGRHRLIEVAGLRVRAGMVIDAFQQLINPGHHLPRFISAFTGITQAMVNAASPVDEVLPAFFAFLDDAPIVGHNVGFDLGFLGYEAVRLGYPLATDGLDTIRLARRLMPGIRQLKLDTLARQVGVMVRDRHRALGDARITQEVFQHLLALAADQGIETLAQLREIMQRSGATRRAVPGVSILDRPTGGIYLNSAWRREFPARPGVYLMKDDRGEVIYVGKAKSLKDRLASYYHQPLGYTRKLDGLLELVQEIEIRVLGSELEALLVESQLIKQLQPRFNVQLRNYEAYPFIKIDGRPYPRVYATREVHADGARYFGPFQSRRVVEAALEVIHKLFPIRTCTRGLPPQAEASEPCMRYHMHRCLAPCRGDVDPAAYESWMEQIIAFLGGEREDLLDRLRQEMWAASARNDFERAASLRDALKNISQVLVGQRLVTGAVEANNLLIIYPSAEAGQGEVFLVRHGRLVEQRRVPLGGEGLQADLRAVIERAAALPAPPKRVGKEEVDQINIIARWIHRHSDEHERAFFALPADLQDVGQLERFIEQVALTLSQTADQADE